MRDLLLISCSYAIWCITAIELLFLIVLFVNFAKTKKKLFLYTALLTTGLFLDALGICLGAVITSPVMRSISRIRFISHGVLIPLLFPICSEALNFSPNWKKIVWGLTAVLMCAGLAEALATVLEPCTIAGVTRYKAAEATPAWAAAISKLLSFGTVIPLMIAGIVAWIKQKTPCLLLAGLLMFIFSALGPATRNTDLIFYISMYGEVLMVLFLTLYVKGKKS